MKYDFSPELTDKEFRICDMPFLKKELDKAYDDYVNDTNVIDIRKLDKVFNDENIFFIKKQERRFDNRNTFTAYFYFKDRECFEKRVCKKIKSGTKFCIKLNWEWRVFDLDINF